MTYVLYAHLSNSLVPMLSAKFIGQPIIKTGSSYQSEKYLATEMPLSKSSPAGLTSNVFFK